MSEQNRAVVDRMTQAFNDGDLELLDELVAPDFVGHNPLSPKPIQGPAGLKGFFGAFRAMAVGTVPGVGTAASQLAGSRPKRLRPWRWSDWPKPSAARGQGETSL